MRINSKKLNEISTHKYSRCDCKFWNTLDDVDFREYVLLKDMFKMINGSVQTTNYITGVSDIPYVRIGDIDYKYGISNDNIIYLSDDTEISEEKTIKSNDLILATIGATVGKIGIGEKVKGGTHSNNTILLRPIDDKLRSAFYEKLFQSDYYIKYIFGLVSQKAQPNLQSYEIENIKVPIVLDQKIDSFLSDITEYEQQINEKKTKILTDEEVINDVLRRFFKIDVDVLYRIDKEKVKRSSFSLVSDKNSTARFSVRWNKGIQIQNALIDMVDSCERLGDHVVSTKNGWSPVCSEQDGLYQVLGIDAINKNGQLSFDNPKFSSDLTKDYHQYIINNGDFFVSRGNTTDLVSLASVARINEESEDTIYPDLMIRVEFDESINKTYLSYVFNSFIGRLYFKYVTKGKNQTMVKVSPKEIRDFWLPLPEVSVQEMIVEEIRREIELQEEQRKEIDLLRGKIDEILFREILSDNC